MAEIDVCFGLIRHRQRELCSKIVWRMQNSILALLTDGKFTVTRIKAIKKKHAIR